MEVHTKHEELAKNNAHGCPSPPNVQVTIRLMYQTDRALTGSTCLPGCRPRRGPAAAARPGTHTACAAGALHCHRTLRSLRGLSRFSLMCHGRTVARWLGRSYRACPRSVAESRFDRLPNHRATLRSRWLGTKKATLWQPEVTVVPSRCTRRLCCWCHWHWQSRSDTRPSWLRREAPPTANGEAAGCVSSPGSDLDIGSRRDLSRFGSHVHPRNRSTDHGRRSRAKVGRRPCID